MPTKYIEDFRPEDNVEIMNRIRYDASTPYQQHVPEATQANIDSTIAAMMDFTPTRNEFISALVNRIGLVMARNWQWENPFGIFKRGMLQYGETIEEVALGLLQAHVYDDDRESMEKVLFSTERPESQSSFHHVNRREFYKITINEMQLRRAFLDPMGLSSFVAQLMQAPTTSDNRDEFTLMTSLFRQNYDNNGFFKVNVPDVSARNSTEADSKALLRSIREYSETLKFISTHYNAARMPIATQPEELVLFTTPQAKAAMDVEALAAAFNIDRADVSTRMVTVPQEYFNIPGAQAMLTTKDFFVVADQVYETTEQYNPAALQSNYFLHHHQVISLSRYVPTILYTTEDGDVITIQSASITEITDIEVLDNTDTATLTLARGEFHQVNAVKTTDPAATPLNVAAKIELIGGTSNFNRVEQTGTVFIGPDETATTLTIRATSVADETVTYEEEFTLTGEVQEVWPVPTPTEPDEEPDPTP